jgi:hypothetical protein
MRKRCVLPEDVAIPFILLRLLATVEFKIALRFNLLVSRSTEDGALPSLSIGFMPD